MALPPANRAPLPRPSKRRRYRRLRRALSVGGGGSRDRWEPARSHAHFAGAKIVHPGVSLACGASRVRSAEKSAVRRRAIVPALIQCRRHPRDSARSPPARVHDTRRNGQRASSRNRRTETHPRPACGPPREKEGTDAAKVPGWFSPHCSNGRGRDHSHRRNWRRAGAACDSSARCSRR